MSEVEKIRMRYERRKSDKSNKYNIFLPYVYNSFFEREKMMLFFLEKYLEKDVVEARVLEIGCGSGDNLLMFLRYGFQSKNIVGNDLLNDRLLYAKKRLPLDTMLISGDGCDLNMEVASFDVILVSTVFTSILDSGEKERLAKKYGSYYLLGG